MVSCRWVVRYDGCLCRGGTGCVSMAGASQMGVKRKDDYEFASIEKTRGAVLHEHAPALGSLVAFPVPTRVSA